MQVRIKCDQCIVWLRYGQFHRVGGPAIAWKNGGQEWFRYGEYHRLNGPAITDSSGWTFYKRKKGERN